MAGEERISLSEAARRSGVSASTLKRWAADKVVPVRRGRWTAAAAAQARVVARMRERGHSLEELRRAGREGRLSFGLAEDLFPAPEEQVTVEDVAARDRPRAGADRAHPRHPRHPARTRAGARPRRRRGAAPLRPGAGRRLPAGRLPAAGPRLRAVDAADRRRRGPAHPPLRPRTDDPRRRPRAGDGGGDRRPRRRRPAAGGAADRVPPHPLPALLPRAGRGRPHGERARRDASQLGQVPVALCFIDLTGFTRYTEEEGDLEALDVVENFVATVEATLPPEATIVKTIGDEVMVVSPDAGSLSEWAVDLLERLPERPRPRVGIHYARGRLPRRRLLRHPRQPRPPGRRPRPRRRGDGHRPGRSTRSRRARGSTSSRSARSASRASPSRPRSSCPRRARLSANCCMEERRTCSSAVRGRRPAAAPARRSSRCSPAGATRSACSTSRCGCSAPEAVTALHVNYGLREDSDEDEAHCAALCERLGVRLEVERPRRPEGPGNLQAWARDVRYAAAARLAEAARAPRSRPATPPTTRSRRSSTGSPPRRAAGRCSGCAPATARWSRPLLGFTRAADDRLLRGARPGLARRPEQRGGDLRPQPGPPRPRRGAGRGPPGGGRERAAHGRAAARRGGGPRRPGRRRARRLRRRRRAGRSRSSASAELPPALRRLVVQQLADRAAGRPVAGAARHAEEVAALRRTGARDARPRRAASGRSSSAASCAPSR